MGLVRLSLVRNAQKIMGNGVIIPPHDFKQPSCWYYRLQEIKQYDFGVITNGITSIPNFINFRPAILHSKNAPKWVLVVKTLD
jgi:hypothetical protein